MRPPHLAKSFLDAMGLAFRERSIVSVIPWFAALVLILPQYWVGDIISNIGESKIDIDMSPFSASLLVMGGFFGAASVNVMREVFSLTSDKDFADYLKTENVLHIYLFWPQFTLLIQMTYIFISSMTIFTHIVFGVDEIAVRMFILNFGFMIYTILKTWQLISMVRELAWYRQVYISKR